MPELKTWECPFCCCDITGAASHQERCDLRHRSTPPASPTVHMNGTGYLTLHAEAEAATHAVDAAINALCKSAPNGRDYYVQDAIAVHAATDQHWDRVKRLQSVKAELEFIWMKISDQEPRK